MIFLTTIFSMPLERRIIFSTNNFPTYRFFQEKSEIQD